MAQSIDQFKPGERVQVTQQIPQRDEVWTQRIEGVVVRAEQRKTGSWFAHSKDHKLWLDRLLVRKDDGELVTFNLDPYTHVELMPGGDPSVTGGHAPDAAAAPDVRPNRATSHSTNEPNAASALGPTQR